MSKIWNISAGVLIPVAVAAGLTTIPAVLATTVNGWLGIALAFLLTWAAGVFLAILAKLNMIPVNRLLQNIRPVGKDVQVSGDIWVPVDEEGVRSAARMVDIIMGHVRCSDFNLNSEGIWIATKDVMIGAETIRSGETITPDRRVSGILLSGWLNVECGELSSPPVAPK